MFSLSLDDPYFYLGSGLVLTCLGIGRWWIKYCLKWQGYQTGYQWYQQDPRRKQFRVYLNLRPALLLDQGYQKSNQELLHHWYSQPITKDEYNLLVKDAWIFLRTIDHLEIPFSINNQKPTSRMLSELRWWQMVVWTQTIWFSFWYGCYFIWSPISEYLFLIRPDFYFYLILWLLVSLIKVGMFIGTGFFNLIIESLSRRIQSLHYYLEGEVIHLIHHR